MLQKEFFQVQPFNPNPYWDPVIVNLSGAQKFDDDTVFFPGKYSVIVQAGASKSGYNIGSPEESYSGKIETIVNISDKFIIRAYCGSRAESQTIPGVNLYSGIYKVNGNISYGSDVPSVNHIFGNAGSCCRIATGSTEYAPSSGNCLGNGAFATQGYNGSCATGAGSCLHFLPVGGIFGTDYLFAFHTTASGSGNYRNYSGNFVGDMGASGSAYGGAGSGSSNSYTISSISYKGGSTPYGEGGPGVSGGIYAETRPGNNGTGIGHGFGGGVFAKGCYAPGAAAYFDGSQWIESTLVAGAREDGKIIVTYLGPLD